MQCGNSWNNVKGWRTLGDVTFCCANDLYICTPLSTQPITYSKERYEYLTDLELVDFPDREEIDILMVVTTIGSW